MTRKQILELYRESPVPVYEVNIRTWGRWYNSITKRDGNWRTLNGAFVYATKGNAARLHKPRRFIVVEKNLRNYEKARVILHEIGHALDFEKYGNMPRWREEVSAERYAMRELVRRNLVRAAVESLLTVLSWADDELYPKDDPYTIAGKKLLKDREYRSLRYQIFGKDN